MQQSASPVLRDSLNISAQARSLFIFFSQRSHTSSIQVIVDCFYILPLHKAEPDDYISSSPDIEGRMAFGILKVLPAISILQISSLLYCIRCFSWKEFLQPVTLLFSRPLSPMSYEKEGRRIQPSATASPQRRRSGSKRRVV